MKDITKIYDEILELREKVAKDKSTWSEWTRMNFLLETIIELELYKEYKEYARIKEG